MKWRQKASSDALLLTGHVSCFLRNGERVIHAERSCQQLLYFGYWMVLLFALINSLGKSDSVTSALQESHAAQVSCLSASVQALSTPANRLFLTAGICQPNTVDRHLGRNKTLYDESYPGDLH